MINAIVLFSIINLIVIIYIYLGYPLILFVLAKIKPAEAVKKRQIRPTVSLLISCYNEEGTIRDKISNSLKLEYPQDKLEIIVISDGSTDKTDDIVREFMAHHPHIRLVRQEGRKGKTSGLNLAVPRSFGEIVVFSDANAMYKKDAVIRLVENFADETVGYVVGEAQYVKDLTSPATESENAYWTYEMQVKKLESTIHSMVGGDGAIYAIRKQLYEPLKETDINDFVNPLQIIDKGYRGIYEPEAVCIEDASGEFQAEFQRKTRIVNRSFSGLLKSKSAINPFRTGLFSFQLVSHKLMRWFSGIFLFNFFISSMILSFSGFNWFQVIVLIQLLFLGNGYAGYLFHNNKRLFPPFYLAYYFILVNIAALNGIKKSLKGTVQVTWSHHRIHQNENLINPKFQIAIHAIALALFISFLFTLQSLLKIDYLTWKLLLWGGIFILAYTYFGYPVLLYIWCLLSPNPVKQDDVTPSVTMLICAHNEEEVIEQKIRNSLDLDYPAEMLRIVIASDGSTDRTVEIARQFKNERLEIIEYPNRCGKIGVINKTVPSLSGDILLFSDSNTMFERSSVKKLVSSFADPGVGGVSADVILESDRTTFGGGESLYYRYERFIQEKESLIESIIGADGGMFAIRRKLFSPPQNDTIIDDFVISMNVTLAGYRFIYEREARGHEGNVNQYHEEFLRKSRVIAGAVQALKNGMGIPRLKQKRLFFCYVSHKVLRWLTPVLLVFVLFANVRLVMTDQIRVYDLLFAIEAAFILLALSGFLLRHWISHPLLIVPFYFCLENVSALYGIYKGLFDKQSVMWRKFQRDRIEAENA